MAGSGNTLREIAELLGISAGSVCRIPQATPPSGTLNALR
jgi:hypothetical protein